MVVKSPVHLKPPMWSAELARGSELDHRLSHLQQRRRAPTGLKRRISRCEPVAAQRSIVSWLSGALRPGERQGGVGRHEGAEALEPPGGHPPPRPHAVQGTGDSAEDAPENADEQPALDGAEDPVVRRRRSPRSSHRPRRTAPSRGCRSSQRRRFPVLGAMTRRRPCSFASMNSSTCGSFLSLCFLDPDSANACFAACSPANRTISMFRAASCAAAARLPRRPGWPRSPPARGAAVDLRRQVRRDLRDARGRGLEGGGGGQEPPRVSPAHEGNEG